MRTLIKIIYESVAQAVQQLRANKLRSFLSLLGISIGIFCIVGVFAGVESLQTYIKNNLERLGNDIVYVQKWPFNFGNIKWWDILKHPHPGHDDYLVIKENVKNQIMTAYYVVVGAKTVKYQSNNVEGTILVGITNESSELFKFEYESGRYFSPAEFNYGSNVFFLGSDVARELFGSLEPLGKKIKMMGRKYEVIGVLEKVGDDDFTPLDYDEVAFVSYYNARNLANLKSKQIFESAIAVKAAPDVKLVNLKDEIRGVLRPHRRLKPREDDNFALNELTMILSVMNNFFTNLNILGIIIGGFAMVVGGVSVANIMFVSVKERTSIIGVKKALGAKRYMILLEFLIESVILCLIGGIFGLFLVFVLAEILSKTFDFSFFLSLNNISVGVLFSAIIGVLSGFIPALSASRMDPVVAMRQK